MPKTARLDFHRPPSSTDLWRSAWACWLAECLSWVHRGKHTVHVTRNTRPSCGTLGGWKHCDPVTWDESTGTRRLCWMKQVESKRRLRANQDVNSEHHNLGGGFKDFLFSHRSLGKWSNLTSIFFNGFNHQLVIQCEPSGRICQSKPRQLWMPWSLRRCAGSVAVRLLLLACSESCCV